jgi:hypothetical protein
MTSPDYFGTMQLMVSGPATHLSLAPLKLRLKKGAIGVAGGIFFGAILIGGSSVMGWRWLFWTGIVLGILVIVASVAMSAKLQIAPCPYCGSNVGDGEDNELSLDDDGKAVECEKCYEWLLSSQGTLGPMDDITFSIDATKARSPLFADGRWPQECLTCGAPATRFEKLTKRSMDGAALLVGRISVRTASVDNVPYCDAHSDQVSLVFADDKPKLEFKQLPSLRRYVSLNFGKKPVKPQK